MKFRFVSLLVIGLVAGIGCARQSGPVTGGEKTGSQKPAEEAQKTPADIAQTALPSVVAIITEDSLGSGFVVGDGLVATNLHVIAGYSKATVVLHDRREFPVIEIYNGDANRDLAILRIDAKDLKPLALGDSDKVRAGESVVAIGHPLGLTDTVSSGLVGAVRKAETGVSVLQISAPIAPGSSGGPLFDDHGRVIGVATAILLGGQNLNLGVPINDVKALLEKSDPVTLAALAKQTKKAQLPAVERKIPHHPLSALDGCSTERISLIAHSIDQAIQVGAPLYNRGDFSSCYHVYEGAALDLERKLGGTCRSPQKALSDGRKRAAAQKTPPAQAWAMRDAFDGLLEVIQRWSIQQKR
jgi:V8-like Glu-specific endopeptidase